MTWSTLQRIGKSPVMYLSLVAPLFAYIIVINPHIKELLTRLIVGYQIQENSTTPVGVYFYYYGTTLLGFGQIIYLLFCPHEVSYFVNDIEYAERTAAGATPQRILAFMQENERYLLARDPSLVALLKTMKDEIRVLPPAILPEQNARFRMLIDNFVDLARVRYSHLNTSSVSARVSCSIFYIIGFILLAGPGFWNFLIISTGKLWGL